MMNAIRQVGNGRVFRALSFRIEESLYRPHHQIRSIEEHAKALVEWLLRAQLATPDGGVSESYRVLDRRWAASYPETTGYIICSILRAADIGLLDREQLQQAAIRMGEWLCDVQLESGAFQGGRIDHRPKKPVVFNTGQILKGLTDLIGHGLDDQGRFARAARRTADWLIANQDADGCWRLGRSILTTEPVQAYDIRTAWSLSSTANSSDVRGRGAQAYATASGCFRHSDRADGFRR